MEKKLPENWTLISFTSIFDINGGTQPPKSEFIYEDKEGYIRLLQIRDFGLKPVPTYIPDTGKLRTCKKSDVLIARYGASIGRILTGMEGAYNVAIAKVKIPKGIENRYVFWLLNSPVFQDLITSFQRTAQNGFNKNDLANIFIPLPPRPEQKRIVAKLDELFGHLELIKAGLARIPALLADLRQSILTQAVTGKLTEEWREGKEIEGWEQVLLDDVVKEKPRNGYSPKGVNYETPVKSLTLSATTSGKFDGSHVKYLDIPIPPNDSYLWLKNGDILIQRSNSLDYVGTSAIYDQKDDEFIYPDLMMKIKVNEKVINHFLNYALSENQVRDYFKANATGTAGNMPKINQGIVMNTPIYLPPLLEQQEIVRRVQSLFAKADAIQTRYEVLKAKIEDLPQAILAKAFRGELVAQLPGDGDARELLREIQALREEMKKKVRKK